MLTTRALPASRTRQSAEDLAVRVFAWIAWTSHERQAFMDATGLSATTIREAAGTSQFLAGVLDYVVDDTHVLLAAARAVEVGPMEIHAARRELLPAASVTPAAFGPGPLWHRCERCQACKPLDRRKWSHVPDRVEVIEIPRCGPCGGGFDQGETWLDAAGCEVEISAD